MDAMVLILGACLVAMTLANLATTFRLLQALGDMSLKLLADKNRDAAVMVAEHVERTAPPPPQRVTPPERTTLDDGYQQWSEEFAKDLNAPFDHGPGANGAGR